MEKSVRGKKYRVVEDSINFFEPEEVVVALEDSTVPYCAREEDFREGVFNEDDYGADEYSPLNVSELEEIEE